MKLIADSGSTKTDWSITQGGNIHTSFSTQGINPFQQDRNTIENIIGNELLPQIKETSRITKIFFYGAGCRAEMIPMMTEVLKKSFKTCNNIEVNSDLLAAARALCGHKEGIACILGTGANSCLYDGEIITANVPPLGYILGDEGSGAVLGRNFVNALFKGRMPKSLSETFMAETGLTIDDVIRKVYREPIGNRFLASFSLFISRHIDEYEELRNLVIDNFRMFFRNNISRYSYNCDTRRNTLKVNAIGSMANYYIEEFKAAAALEGFMVGKVERSPMKGLIAFHG